MLPNVGPFGLSAVAGASDVVTSNYTVQEGVERVICDATNGAFTVTLPPSWLSGNRIIKITKLDSTSNAVTIATVAGDTALTSRTLILSYQYGSIELLGCAGPTSVTKGWLLLSTSRFSAPIQISSSCGSFSTNSTSATTITSLSVTLIPTGNPVKLSLIDDGSLTASNLNGINTSGTASSFIVSFWRDSTQLTASVTQTLAPTGTIGLEVSGSTYTYPDTSYTAGVSHTYTVTTQVGTGTSAGASHLKLVAEETP